MPLLNRGRPSPFPWHARPKTWFQLRCQSLLQSLELVSCKLRLLRWASCFKVRFRQYFEYFSKLHNDCAEARVHLEGVQKLAVHWCLGKRLQCDVNNFNAAEVALSAALCGRIALKRKSSDRDDRDREDRIRCYIWYIWSMFFLFLENETWYLLWRCKLSTRKGRQRNIKKMDRKEKKEEEKKEQTDLYTLEWPQEWHPNRTRPNPDRLWITRLMSHKTQYITLMQRMNITRL